MFNDKGHTQHIYTQGFVFPVFVIERLVMITREDPPQKYARLRWEGIHNNVR